MPNYANLKLIVGHLERVADLAEMYGPEQREYSFEGKFELGTIALLRTHAALALERLNKFFEEKDDEMCTEAESTKLYILKNELDIAINFIDKILMFHAALRDLPRDMKRDFRSFEEDIKEVYNRLYERAREAVTILTAYLQNT